MRAYALTHVRDEDLLRDLAALVARDRATTAELLAHIAEVDARRLYLPAAYPSMHAYCVGELHLSEDAAYKRIQAARAARRYPVLFAAVADGRLHLAAVCLLAPHLTPENVEALVARATHRRKSEIEAWLVEGPPARDGTWPGATPRDPGASLAPGQVTALAPSPQAAGQLAPGQVEAQATAPPATRIALHLAIGEQTQAKLRYAQALLGHAVPSGDVAEVLDRALDALISQLEKRKFAATAKPMPRAPRQTARHPRTEPADVRLALPARHRRALSAPVRRAVWERDQGRCTFRSEAGRPCGSRTRLEFDHVVPVARGGGATVEGLRLRCRGHNQYEAERAFGAEFMSAKRQRARGAGDPGDDQTQDIHAALRGLGFRALEARRGAEYAATLPAATLEDRLRAALQLLGRKLVARAG